MYCSRRGTTNGYANPLLMAAAACMAAPLKKGVGRGDGRDVRTPVTVAIVYDFGSICCVLLARPLRDVL
jgi:hypothetical protein